MFYKVFVYKEKGVVFVSLVWKGILNDIVDSVFNVVYIVSIYLVLWNCFLVNFIVSKGYDVKE